jgi:hypothetical protein
MPLRSYSAGWLGTYIFAGSPSPTDWLAVWLPVSLRFTSWPIWLES